MKTSELKKLIKEAIANSQNQVDVENTPDEKMLRDAIEASSSVKTRLGAISNINELDGFFKALISFTQIEKASKMTIMSSLKKALDSISSEPIITTKKDKSQK